MIAINATHANEETFSPQSRKIADRYKALGAHVETTWLLTKTYRLLWKMSRPSMIATLGSIRMRKTTKNAGMTKRPKKKDK